MSTDHSMSGYTRKEGWLWPAADEECFRACKAQVKDIQTVLEHVKEKNVCVQAGGNCGFWPEELAKHFEVVYTFEPDPVNFRCLVNNANASNVFMFNSALGDKHQCVDLKREPKNVGAHQVAGDGNIPTLRIDDLALETCDLIYLDVEGFELQALWGAEETLRHKPVVALEQKGIGKNYGYSDSAVENWLAQRGYRKVGRIANDSIFTC